MQIFFNNFSKTPVFGCKTADFANNPIKLQQPLRVDMVTFKGKAPVFSYGNFLKELEKAYSTRDFDAIADEIMQDDRNEIGRGTSKIVYNIPGVHDFVLAEIIGGSAQEDDIFKAVENKYPKYNFGQYIAAKGNRLKVMGRVEGDSHGLKDWGVNAAKIADTDVLIPKEEAKAFLNGLQDIEKFPLSSYIDLAEQFKYLSEKNTRIDCVNPNNILIDRNSKRFRHIDLPFRQFLYTDFKKPLNTVDDMIGVLCDFTLHTAYLNSLNQADARALKDTTVNIILKCRQAGQIVGLDEDEENLVRNLKMKDDARAGTDLPKYHFLKHYLEFTNIYKSALSES